MQFLKVKDLKKKREKLRVENKIAATTQVKSNFSFGSWEKWVWCVCWGRGMDREDETCFTRPVAEQTHPLPVQHSCFLIQEAAQMGKAVCPRLSQWPSALTESVKLAFGDKCLKNSCQGLRRRRFIFHLCSNESQLFLFWEVFSWLFKPLNEEGIEKRTEVVPICNKSGGPHR